MFGGDGRTALGRSASIEVVGMVIRISDVTIVFATFALLLARTAIGSAPVWIVPDPLVFWLGTSGENGADEDERATSLIACMVADVMGDEINVGCLRCW